MNFFKIDSPTVISFSGGRTSAYLLWRVLQENQGLPDDARVIFCNTGKEHEATLDFVHACSVNWHVPITWLEYTGDDDKFRMVTHETASRDGEPFARLIEKRKYLPNPVSRFCTSELKVLTIHRYMKSIGENEFEQMLGIRADEKRRVAKLKDNNRTPLVNAGVTQHHVQEFWNNNSFNLDLQFRNGVTNLGNCDLCFLKGPNQVLSIIRNKPERAMWWAIQEEKIGGTFRSDRPSYKEMMRFAQNQSDMFDSDDEGIDCFCGD